MALRLSLFLIWFLGFLGSLHVVLHALNTLPAADQVAAKDVVQPLVAIFVPYLGPIIAFWFAQQNEATSRTAPSTAFYVALICSLAFNAVLLVELSRLLGVPGLTLADINRRLGNAGSLATLLAFLVGPAIGFYFGRTRS